jgi:hypothetical protein
MSHVSPEVRQYLKQIGAKGGKKGGAAGKGDPKRSELNRKAALARWSKRKNQSA